MGDLSSAGEKDPYMQAYITARMKNQVEEMKLQKLLSTMEVSQRVRKIMINLELYEDRKMAHKLQKERHCTHAAHPNTSCTRPYLKFTLRLDPAAKCPWETISVEPPAGGQKGLKLFFLVSFALLCTLTPESV